MKGKTLGYFALVALVGVVTTQAHAQLAISSTMDIGVNADANRGDGTSTQATYSDFQIGTLNTMVGSLSVTDLSTSTATAGGSVTVSSSALASWASAGQGHVFLRSVGWDLATPHSFLAETNSAYISPDAWTYTFQATSNGLFTMNYDVTGTGFLFGLQGAQIHWSGPGGNLDLTNAFDPTASGVFNRNLVSGDIYTVGIASYGNISGQSGATLAGAMTGEFDWKVTNTSVPGPAALLPFAGGLLVALRRRFKK